MRRYLLVVLATILTSGCVYMKSGKTNMWDAWKAGEGIYWVSYEGIDNLGDSWEEWKKNSD